MALNLAYVAPVSKIGEIRGQKSSFLGLVLQKSLNNLPELLTGASYNDRNQSIYVVTSSNQTYLPITTHFGGYRGFSGKLLSDFWSTRPKNDDFWRQISTILLAGASYNEKKQSKYVVTSSN